MNPSFHIRRALAVGFIGIAALALPAAADTIYFDDFNDQQNINKGAPYTQSLAGSVPSTRNGILGGNSSATWSFSVETGGWGQRDLADNNVATPTSSNYLSFTPEAGYLYTVEADITVNVSIDSNWFTLGFTATPNNWGSLSGAFNTADYDTGTQQGIVRWQAPNVGVTRHVKYTLDTTAPGWTNTQNIAYAGWFTANAGGVNLNGANQVSIDNFSLTSGVPNPTVTYNGNGSDGGIVPTDGSSPYTYGATVTALGAGTMTRDGYTFQFWSTAADGSGTNYNPGDSFTIQNNTTLYARWLLDGSAFLTYDGNGNTGGSIPVDANSPYAGGSTVTVLGNTGSLIRASYTFSGWNTAANGSGTNYSPDDTFTLNSDTTLYAQWTVGPDYVWDNGAATDAWNATDTNWSGPVWTNSGSNNAFFRTVGDVVNLDTITAGDVNVGMADSNFANVTFSGGSLSAASLTVQGKGQPGGNNGNYAASPSLSLDSAVTISGDTAVGRANLNITDGTLTTDRIISAPASADWARLVVSGGTVIATNGVDGSVNTTATFAIDLNGGELHAPSIRVADREAGSNNNAWLTFNGGTLKATGADNADFITTYGGGQNTYVASGGAIIDTNSLNIGILVNLLNAGGGGGLTKEGAGILTLGGANTYTGDTTVNTGTLVLADNSQLKFVVTEAPASNMVTGSGTATFNGDFNIDTTAVTGSTGFIWTLVDRATLTSESFDDATFTVIGFTDANNDGVWIMTDAKGDWSFSEVTGELTLDIGTDYDDWKSANGVTGGDNDDDDNDGLTNHEEYAFGLDPTGGGSVNPIAVQLNKTGGTFTYTRRDPSLPDPALTYTVWYSTDLAIWTEDTGAVEGITTISGEVQTVPVTISPALLTNSKLFIQVRAD